MKCSLMLSLIIVATACTQQKPTPKAIDMANPASVYCVKMKGT